MRKLVKGLFVVSLMISYAHAIGNKFKCEAKSFVSYNTEQFATAGASKYNTISLKDGSVLSTDNISGVSGVNSIGYNVKDNYIWGWNLNANKVVQIDADKNSKLYDIAGLDKRFYVAADVDQNGILYLFSRGSDDERTHIARVDLNTLKNLPEITLNRAINTADIAFHPDNGKLYFVESHTDKLYSITIDGTNGTVDNGRSMNVNGMDDIIINYFDKDGNFYFNVGIDKVYKYNVSTSTKATLFSSLDNNLRNGDGARCANAKVDEPIIPVQEVFACETSGTVVSYSTSGSASSGDSNLDLISISDGKIVSHNVLPDPTVGVNSIGYNVKDNYVWGYNIPKRSIVRIGADNSVNYYETDKDVIPNGKYANAVDISSDGIMYLKADGYEDNIFRVKLDGTKYTQEVLQPIILQNGGKLNSDDFAFNPIDGMIYFVDKGDGYFKRVKITGTTGVVENVKQIGQAWTIIAAFDKDGNFYYNSRRDKNKEGQYINKLKISYNGNSMDTNKIDIIKDFSYIKGVTQGDGARCANAPMGKPEPQPKKFECSQDAYLFSGKDPSKSYSIMLSDGKYKYLKGFENSFINATGYSVTDDLIWGYDIENQKVVRIDADFNITSYSVASLPEGNYYAGDVSQDGFLYLKKHDDSYLYKIDINSGTPKYISKISLYTIQMMDMISVKSLANFGDFAFNPKDNMLYGISETDDSTYNHLYKIDPSDGKTIDLGIANPDVDVEYHTFVFDKAGTLYFYGVKGIIYKIEIGKGKYKAEIFKETDIKTAGGDGARCPNATMPEPKKKAFECNSNSYIFASDKDATFAQSQTVDLTSGNITIAKEKFGTYHLNAIGFNPVDGFIYGWQSGPGLSSDNNWTRPDAHLVKVDANYNVYDVDLTTPLSDSKMRYFLGDVSKDGIYYMANMNYLEKIRVIDLNSKTPQEDIVIQYKNGALPITNADFAINPKDNNLYMINGNNNQLIRIILRGSHAGEYEELGEVYEMADNGNLNTYSVFDFFDKFGNFYFQIGKKIYRIDISEPWSSKNDKKAEAIPFSTISLTTSGDGARCSLAAVGNVKPIITVKDTSIVEGDSGEKNMVFEVKILNNDNPSSLSVKYQTFDGNDTSEKLNATSSEDYLSVGVEKDFKIARDFNITVPIKGDRKVEADEELLLKLSVKAGNYQTSNQGVLVAKGTILDDDRGKGICYATTDNKKLLYIYDKLDSGSLSDPVSITLSKNLYAEGGAYRAIDGYIYQFTDDGDTPDTYNDDKGPNSLYKINLENGDVTLVKKELVSSHVDAAEFYYDPDSKKDIFYVIQGQHDKDKDWNPPYLHAYDPSNDWKELNGYPKELLKDDGHHLYPGGLAIDPYSGKAYAMKDYDWDDDEKFEDENSKPKLYELDLKTGIGKKLFNLPSFIDAEGLAFADDGYLYTENESLDKDEKLHHKIFRVDISSGKITPVSNSGTAGSSADIETFSCNGGEYLVPPRFKIAQKEIDITEGNPTDITKDKELNPEEISLVIRANRPIREDDGAISFAPYIQKNNSTATVTEDYKEYSKHYEMLVGESELNISKALVYSDLKVENDEYLNIALVVDKGSFVDEKNNVKVNIIDDDFTTFTAYDTNQTGSIQDRNITTKIVGEPFTLTLANINNPDNIEDVNRSTTRVRIVEHKECNKRVEALNISDYSLFDMPEGDFDVNVDFTINSAMRDANVQFIWRDRKGTLRTSCSSDRFAIRPKEFSFSNGQQISQALKATAGKPYGLSLYALSGADHQSPSSLYNEENGVSFKIDANQTQPDKCSYDSSEFDDSNMTAFVNGTLDGTIRYGDVGKLTIKVSEINGSEFAKVDENDTSWTNRVIASKSIQVEFRPDHFDINVSMDNKHTDSGYAFYSNDVEDSPTWMIQATAKDDENNTLKNFDNTCQAKTVDLDMFLDINASDELVLLSNIEDNTTISKSSSGTTSLKLDSNISSFTEGVGTLDVKFNFKRAVSHELDPALLNMKQVDLKIVDENVTGTKVTEVPMKYQYMRAYIQDPIAVIGKKSITTKVYYETYESSSRSVRAVKGNRSKSGERNWHKVKEHDNKSGKMIYSVKPFMYSGTSAGCTGTSGRLAISHESDTSVKITATKLPEKNVVILGVDDDFRTSISSSTIDTHVTFRPDTVNWAGDGDTGMIVDTNVSTRVYKKMNW